MTRWWSKTCHMPKYQMKTLKPYVNIQSITNEDFIFSPCMLAICTSFPKNGTILTETCKVMKTKMHPCSGINIIYCEKTIVASYYFETEF